MSQYKIEDLLYLMARLREPEFGCPWDIKQTFDTILPHTLEEVYEVADTIEQKDFDHLKEELGDLLFQIVFYAQMGKEESHFNFDDIVHTLVEKLVRRHPHVFPNRDLYGKLEQGLSEEEIKDQWDQIKAEEKAEKFAKAQKIGINGLARDQKTYLLDDVPNAFPALQRAEKLQRKAAKVGFDWGDTKPVIAKIREELEELEQAIDQHTQQEIADEMGDILFAVTNLSRHLDVNPEAALRSTNQKFESRFNFVEDSVDKSARTWQDHSLEELEEYWQSAKKKEREKD